MSLAKYFGVLAGLLHVVGFIIYARRIRAGEIVAHGASWAMRCYGAMVNFLIFAKVGIPLAVLIQPAVSGLCALTITIFPLNCGAWLRPTRADMLILAADLAHLLVYIVLREFPSDPQNTLLVRGVVAVTVLRKIVPYLPVLRTVAVDP